MESLRRVSAGAYTIDKAIPLAELVNHPNPESCLLAVDSMFTQYPAVTLTDKQALRCRNGNRFTVDMPNGTYRAYGPAGEFLMLAAVVGGVMSTIKSFFEVE